MLVNKSGRFHNNSRKSHEKFYELGTIKTLEQTTVAANVPAIAGALEITGGLQAIDLSPKFFTTNITCAILLSPDGGKGGKLDKFLLFATRVAKRVGPDTCSERIFGSDLRRFPWKCWRSFYFSS